MKFRRGNIYFADLNPHVGSEQGGIRPVVILQNNQGNMFSPTVIVASITSSGTKTSLPTHVKLQGNYKVISDSSIVLLEQIRTLDKSRLLDFIDKLKKEDMESVDKACLISMGLDKYIH